MRTRIDQLRIHLKENILYYMQAIWAHEPADQRYFRLYDQEVIWPETNGKPKINNANEPEQEYKIIRVLGIQIRVKLPKPSISDDTPKKSLHQVADLDKLLGFKGNYGIFPLRETNAVTDFMAQDFRDDYFGIKDPDGSDKIPTNTEAYEIAKEMWNKAEDQEAKDKVIKWMQGVLENPVSDEIVIPSGELFVEALPGAHPLLEDFKLQHRAIDLEQARQALTHDRIDTLRRVKRIMDGDLSDPDVDKIIQVTGAENVNVDAE